MVGYTLAHPVAVALPGLPLALVGACGCIAVKESEHFTGLPDPASNPWSQSPWKPKRQVKGKQLAWRFGKGQARLRLVSVEEEMKTCR